MTPKIVPIWEQVTTVIISIIIAALLDIDSKEIKYAF